MCFIAPRPLPARGRPSRSFEANSCPSSRSELPVTRPAKLLSLPSPTGPGDVKRWPGLSGCAHGLAIAELVRERGLCVVVTPDALAAQRLADELGFFLADAPELGVAHLPDWETLPYDQFSPYQDIVSERLRTLVALAEGALRGVLLLSVATALHRLTPAAHVLGSSFMLEVGQKLDMDTFRRRLEKAGYNCVNQVLEHGDFAVRGALLDLFPMGSDEPVRIDLFDDEIDTLRLFDPETQRSGATIDKLHLLPARECPLDEDAITRFRSNWRQRFEGRAIDCPVYKDVSDGLAPAGIEYYLPLFFDSTATLFDYLPEACTVVLDAGVQEAGERFLASVAERWEQYRHDVEHPILKPQELFLRSDEFMGGTRRWPSVRIEALAVATTVDADASPAADALPEGAPAPTTTLAAGEAGRATTAYGDRSGGLPNLALEPRAPDPVRRLREFLASKPGRVLLLAESAGRREVLMDLLAGQGMKPRLLEGWSGFLEAKDTLALAVAPLEAGLWLREAGIAVIAEPLLYGERVTQRKARKRSNRDPESIVRDLTELSLGAPVVHEQHGVGRYLGLITLEAGGVKGEFLHLEYAEGDKLYVPVAQLAMVSRYAGMDPENVPLHKLGSSAWSRARARAAQRIRDVAAELLELHAKRAAKKGQSLDVERDAYRAFADGFPFEETPDQLSAIEAVLADMRSTRPMDRLVCGDVGFGKTEVAMRAAFVAVQAGLQVAVLVPTTLLAQQHYQDFHDRFADWPVRVESLSRFRSRKEEAAILEGLTDGRVDIVIGTHKLLAEGVQFKRLGLVIVDEEHRFGVRQKERLKSLRAEVDILTLTATPIPRTLSMALSGTRELSVIATPPAKRLAIKTFVREWNNGMLSEALLREIGRGGQVYFVNNDIEHIFELAEQVEQLVPQARVRVAHGQMPERELERTMLDFYHQRFNVLVCTTIIETGIDIPTANTIIINRADRFGLAQLYQLRGRVGRSHHRAYAYLLVPSVKNLAGDAKKRLEAIESLEELGVGFTIASHDLEIRGAGEILGDGQSGHIQEIGFSLYSELLERAVEGLKSGRMPDLDQPMDRGPEIDLRVPALIPDDYLPDVHTRLMLYKRIAGCLDEESLDELRAEMVDRFGPLPEATRNLHVIARMKLRAKALGIRKVDIGPDGGRIQFDAEPNIDLLVLMKFVQGNQPHYRFDGTDKLRILRNLPEPADRLGLMEKLLELLSQRAAAA
jgi:transcription-repair coupling factor (superfamily II helicase)